MGRRSVQDGPGSIREDGMSVTCLPDRAPACRPCLKSTLDDADEPNRNRDVRRDAASSSRCVTRSRGSTALALAPSGSCRCA
eukprot:scaffold162245_cov32-Tisochrysis_lutea.AAC.3